MRTGQCLCGSVAFEVETHGVFNICYCKMCQRWSAGSFMSVPTKAFHVTEGEEHLKVARTSDWADRAFCKLCGSNIYYHARERAEPSVTLGNLDDPSGLTLTKEYFIDRKPESFTIAEETQTMTEAECMAHFAPDDQGHQS